MASITWETINKETATNAYLDIHAKENAQTLLGVAMQQLSSLESFQ